MKGLALGRSIFRMCGTCERRSGLMDPLQEELRKPFRGRKETLALGNPGDGVHPGESREGSSERKLEANVLHLVTTRNIHLSRSVSLCLCSSFTSDGRIII